MWSRPSARQSRRTQLARPCGGQHRPAVLRPSTSPTAIPALIGPMDGDILHQPEQGAQAHGRIRERAPREIAARLPGRDLLLPARRHHRPDPELRRAGPHRLAGDRAERRGEPGLRRHPPKAPDSRCLRHRRHAACSRRRTIPQLRRGRGPHPRRPARRDREGRDQQVFRHDPRRQRPDGPRPTG